jgi:hypothetical protein
VLVSTDFVGNSLSPCLMPLSTMERRRRKRRVSCDQAKFARSDGDGEWQGPDFFSVLILLSLARLRISMFFGGKVMYSEAIPACVGKRDILAP